MTLPAACSTAEWIATYTVTETCTGDESKWTTPAVPANFVVTTVTCDQCAHPTQTITCPNARGTAPAVVVGNGGTATVAPTEAAAMPAVNMLPAGGAAPAGDAAPAAAMSTMSTAVMAGQTMSPTMVGAYQTAAAPAGMTVSGLAMGAVAAALFLGAVLA